jgi:hypothetical protein
MKRSMIWALAISWAWSAACALGQQRVIQPAPSYYQGGTTYVPHTPAVQPVAGPVYTAPHPVQPGVPASPTPRMTLAPAPVEEEEEGLYWFWGQKWPGIALGPKIGTTGIGADLTFGINRLLNLRSGFNYGSFTWSPEFGDIEYDMDLNMTSIPLVVDLHPFAGNFRITGGFYIQPGTEAEIQATPNKNVQIGEHTYPPEVVGTLSGKIKVADTLAPYVGFGFGNAVGEDRLLTFMMDLGVIFQSYDASLTSNGQGMTAKLDTFRKDIQKEEANLQKDMDGWKVFPVLTLGLAFHF